MSLKLLFILFSLVLNGFSFERRESNPGIRKYPNQYTILTSRILDLEGLTKRNMAENEILRHEVEFLRKELDKVKQNMEISAIKLKDEISNLKKRLDQQSKKTAVTKTSNTESKKNIKQLKPDTNNNTKNLKQEKKTNTPVNSRDLLLKIKKMIENNRYTLALREIDTILSTSPKKFLDYWLFYRASCLLGLKKYDEAAYIFLDVYNRWPKGSLAKASLERLAECLKQQGQLQKAKIVLEKVRVDFGK